MLQLLDDLLKIRKTTHEILPPDGEVLRIPITDSTRIGKQSKIGHIAVTRRESFIEIALVGGTCPMPLALPNKKYNISDPTFDFSGVTDSVKRMRTLLINCLSYRQCH